MKFNIMFVHNDVVLFYQMTNMSNAYLTHPTDCRALYVKLLLLCDFAIIYFTAL